jgi:uncharacterized lipoprotein YddW (UPF0748 family)
VLVSGGGVEDLSRTARAEGLEFHRWIWTLNRSGDAWVKEHHPEWFTVSRNGESSLTNPPYVGYYQWLCPTRPEVRDYLASTVDELAQDDRLDGVHLDYVRHCDVVLPRGLWAKYGLIQDREHPEFDFCYCEVCRSRFREESGTDPLELPDPTADEAWRRFRWESVTGLVEALSRVARARGKPITAAVFPTPAIARRLVRQSWDRWPVDEVYPMLYHAFYEEGLGWIGRCVAEGLEGLSARTGSNAPGHLHAGLYLPDLPSAELAQAVRLAREAGAAGVSLFEMGGITDEHLEALAGAETR